MLPCTRTSLNTGLTASQLRQENGVFTERDELEMVQWVSEALQNHLRSNLVAAKAIFSQQKIAR
ncbi:hypothetical protein D3C84_1318820 [compost metagenome]